MLRRYAVSCRDEVRSHHATPGAPFLTDKEPHTLRHLGTFFEGRPKSTPWPRHLEAVGASGEGDFLRALSGDAAQKRQLA